MRLSGLNDQEVGEGPVGPRTQTPAGSRGAPGHGTGPGSDFEFGCRGGHNPANPPASNRGNGWPRHASGPASLSYAAGVADAFDSVRHLGLRASESTRARSTADAESPPPVAVEVGGGLPANPDSGAKGLSAEGVAELTLDSGAPGRFGEPPSCWGFRLPLPPTARCGLDANRSLGPWLSSKVQFVPSSGYRRARFARCTQLAWLSAVSAGNQRGAGAH